MVRTRKKDYTDLVRRRKHHRMCRQPSQTKLSKARTPEAKHIGKRNHGGVFVGFQKLPCELRLMVWKAAMTPRLVAVRPQPCSKDPQKEMKPQKREITLLRGIPALLAVNKEARHVALRHYTWRFTIDMTMSSSLPFDGWRGRYRLARVVMSPDDTLGLFCFQTRWAVQISKFDVKVANEKTSPWGIHETTDAPQQGFKKVAILGNAIRSNLHIVRALNITLWDLNSFLHAQCPGMRAAHSPHTKQEIFVKSGRATTVDWSVVTASTMPLEYLDRQSPDIVAYELADGEKREVDWENFLRMLPQTRMGMWFLS